MDSVKFTNVIAEYLRLKLSEVFHVGIISRTGIDLSDEDVGIEIKCRYSKYPNSYAVHAYQITEFADPNIQLFWAFLLYDLKKPIKNISDDDNLREIVTDVSVKFAPWDFVKKFHVSNAKTGPYVYVNTKDIDTSELKKYVRDKLTLYIPPGILEEKLNSPEMKNKYENNKSIVRPIIEDII
ncbi:MAG: hypothetical protein ACP5NV_00660 [Candidatus Woesearchaeota archaeon]